MLKLGQYLFQKSTHSRDLIVILAGRPHYNEKMVRWPKKHYTERSYLCAKEIDLVVDNTTIVRLLNKLVKF